MDSFFQGTIERAAALDDPGLISWLAEATSNGGFDWETYAELNPSAELRRALEGGRMADGRQLLRIALVVSEVARDEEAYAWCSFQLAMIVGRFEGPIAAVPLFEEALAILRGSSPGTANIAMVMHEHGKALYRSGSNQKAEELLREALEIEVALRMDNLLVAQTRYFLGEVAYASGRLVEAHTQYEKCVQIEERLSPNTLDIAETYSCLGLASRKMGRLGNARRWHLRALRIRRQLNADGTDIARTLHNLGVVANQEGRLERARLLFGFARQILAAKAPESVLFASTLAELSEIAFHFGDFDDASALLEEAMNLKERIAPGSLSLAETYDAVGKLALHGAEALAAGAPWAERLLRYNESREWFTKALTIRISKAPTGLDTAGTYVSLGQLDLQIAVAGRGRLDESERVALIDRSNELLAAALKLHETQAGDSLGTAAILHAQSCCTFERGDAAAAEVMLRRALSIIEVGAPRSIAMAATLSQLSAVLDSLCEPGEAEEFAEKAWTVIQSYGRGLDPRSLGMLLSNYVVIFERPILLAVARKDAARILRGLEEFRELIETSLDGTPRNRPEVAPEMVNLRVQLEETTARIAFLATTIVKPGASPCCCPEMEELGHLMKSRAETSSKLEAAAENALLKALKDLNFSIEAVTVNLGDSALVHFLFLSDGRLLAFVYSDGVWHWRVHSVDSLLAMGLSVWAAKLGMGPLTAVECDEIGLLLWELLPAGAALGVSRSSRVYVCPDGILWQLPFALLKPSEKANFLASDADVVCVLSVADILHSKRLGERCVVPKAFFGGIANFDNRSAPFCRISTAERSLWADLPYARDELVSGAAYYEATAFVDAEFNRETFRGRLASGLIVICSHGVVADSGPPDEMGFVIAALDTNLDIFTAREFGAEPLAASLVILSTCVSARGRVVMGSGLNGMVRILRRAGAACVVGALGAVNDRETSLFMLEFHKVWSAGSKTIGEAFISARRNSEVSPATWSSFIVSGDTSARWPAGH